MAFSKDVTARVHAQGVYAARAQNPTSNTRDGIVSGGFASELAAVSGSVETG